MDVLVVDDNEINATVYQRVVSWLDGYGCRCFSRPDEALAWSAQNAPALLLVDYAMPGQNGIDFVRAFRQIPGRENVPVIMLTGMNSARVRDEAHAAGVGVFLPKPIDPNRFLSEARRLLGIRNAPKRTT